MKGTINNMGTDADVLHALLLAQSHISWLWDIVEEHTRYTRKGTNLINILNDKIEILQDRIKEREIICTN